MKHFPHDSVPRKEVTSYGSRGTYIQIFIDESEAPHYIMRRFEITPGGEIGVHSHAEEHEIFILEGELDILDEKNNATRVSAGEFVYVSPDEPHGYKNPGPGKAAFICVVPKKDLLS